MLEICVSGQVKTYLVTGLGDGGRTRGEGTELSSSALRKALKMTKREPNWQLYST